MKKKNVAAILTIAAVLASIVAFWFGIFFVNIVFKEFF